MTPNETIITAAIIQAEPVYYDLDGCEVIDFLRFS